jgi:menaquinone-dependent protoporphyrinogen oxidase
MTSALVVYGTRYGATRDTSMIIVEVLRKEGFDVKIVDAKKEKVKSVNDFDLIIVGSGIKIGKWTKEPENFLRNFQKELSTKKVALFVCCGGATPLTEGEEKIQEMEDNKSKYLEEKAIQYNLNPISLGFFGGIYDFNKMSWFLRKTMSGLKPKLEEAGYKEIKNGIYDTRKLNTIRNWTKIVAQIVNPKK